MLPDARPGVACSCQHEGMTVSSAPLIGRDADVARLDDALERARSGSPVFARLRGEAGMGKSRLVDAFADRLGDDAIVGAGSASISERSPRRTRRSHPCCGRSSVRSGSSSRGRRRAPPSRRTPS